MKLNQIKTGAILSYVQMALNILIGLIYTPIMIKSLGQSEFGLYNTIASTISMLSILSMGLNSGYIKYYSKYKADGDEKSISVLNGTFLLVFSIIGAISLAIGGILTFNLELVFSTGLTSGEYEIARTLMVIMVVNLALSFPMSVFGNMISAQEKFIFLKSLGIVKSLLGPMITFPLLLLGYRSIAMVLVSFFVAVFVDVIYLVYVLAVLRCLFALKKNNGAFLKDLFKYTSAIALISIVDTINWQIDKVVLGRFRGTAMVAIYSVGYSLQTYFMMFSVAVSGIFTPKIHRIVNQSKDKLEMRSALTGIFTRVGRLQYLLLSLVLSGFVFFGNSFIKRWVGAGYDDSYFVALLLMVAAIVPYIQNTGIEMQRSQNKHYFRGVLYLSIAIVNFVISIFLCQLYGAIGCAIGTAVTMLIGNVIIMNVYYHKRCHINIFQFWKNILSIMKGQIIPVVAGILIMRFIDMSNIFVMLVWIAIYSAIYCLSVWLLSMNRYEKDLVLAPMKKILGLVFKRKNEQT